MGKGEVMAALDFGSDPVSGITSEVEAYYRMRTPWQFCNGQSLLALLQRCHFLFCINIPYLLVILVC